MARIIDTFDDECFDVKGIKNATKAEWKEYRLKVGNYERMRQSIKSWRANKRKSPPVERLSPPEL